MLFRIIFLLGIQLLLSSAATVGGADARQLAKSSKSPKSPKSSKGPKGPKKSGKAGKKKSASPSLSPSQSGAPSRAPSGAPSGFCDNSGDPTYPQKDSLLFFNLEFEKTLPMSNQCNYSPLLENLFHVPFEDENYGRGTFSYCWEPISNTLISLIGYLSFDDNCDYDVTIDILNDISDPEFADIMEVDGDIVPKGSDPWEQPPETTCGKFYLPIARWNNNKSLFIDLPIDQVFDGGCVLNVP